MAPADEQRRAYAALLIRYAGELAKAEAAWTDGDRPPQVTAVADVLDLDPDMLWDHVEGIHGWEPHDKGYEDAVWAAAECREHDGQLAEIDAAWKAAGAVPGTPARSASRQVRVRQRRKRRRR